MQKFIKRTIDILASSIGLIVLSPVLIIVAILVRTKLGSPIFFTQDRVGKDGKIFKMIKFRTMLDATDKWGEPLPDEDRLTPFGKLLRSTSLDELPELFNVFKGDMSLVGPRPPIPTEVMQYNEYQFKRLSVKPGITCIWQVSGRNDIDFDEWVELDLKYIRERSILLDLKLIFMTIPALLGDKHAS